MSVLTRRFGLALLLVMGVGCVYDYECREGAVRGSDGRCEFPTDDDMGSEPGDLGVDAGDEDSFVDPPPRLTSLQLVEGRLESPFDPETLSYDAFVGGFNGSVNVLATTDSPGAVIVVEEEELVSGMLSSPIALTDLATTIPVVVRSPSGASTEYRVTARQGELGTYFKAFDSDSGDFFGHEVALDGDTLAIAALTEDGGDPSDPTDDSAADAGAVYVFRRTGTEWVEEAYLKGSDTQAGDLFGASVALSGDTLVVGTLERNDGAGGVYVFRRSGSTWTEEDILEHPSPQPNDRFGNALAVSGDVLVVGCRGDDSNATGVGGDPGVSGTLDSGAIFVYRRDSRGDWIPEAFIKAEHPGESDVFGWSVDAHGDLIAVGAIYEDSDATTIDGDATNDLRMDSGATYVFRHDGTSWSQVAYLKAPNADPGDNFGQSVAITDEFVAVGAPRERSTATGIGGDPANDGAVGAGAVYVFRWASGSLVPPSYLKAFNTDAGDEFGRELALDGTVLIVGAATEDSGATLLDGDQTDNSAENAGAAYIFRFTGFGWEVDSYVKAPNTSSDAFFGTDVSVSQGVVAIGSDRETSDAVGVNGTGSLGALTIAGAAYVY